MTIDKYFDKCVGKNGDKYVGMHDYYVEKAW